MVSAEFHPTKEIYTFEEVLKSVSESLRSQISRENLEKLFSYNVSNEKLLAARIVPLFLKIWRCAMYTQPLRLQTQRR